MQPLLDTVATLPICQGASGPTACLRPAARLEGAQHVTQPDPPLRWTDISAAGALVEYRVLDGALSVGYVGASGWDPIDTPPADLVVKMEFHRALASRPWGPLFRAALETVHRSVRRIARAARRRNAPTADKTRIFAPGVFGPGAKPLLAVDVVEETLAAEVFRRLCRRYEYQGLEPQIYGEESLHDSSLDVSHEARPFVLADIVDGTDEVEQGTNDWCSSLVVFNPPERRIVGAFVGMPDGMIYFAMNDLVGKCRSVLPAPSVSPAVFRLDGPSGVTALAESLVAFSGHKPARLEILAKDHRVQSLLSSMTTSRRARIRTQGGQPMMVRLVDKRGHRQVDAVFETRGQAAHDVVGALHIALTAGATLCDLRGRPVDLCGALCRPADPRFRLRYVLAASPGLAAEICGHLGASESRRWNVSRLLDMSWRRPRMAAA